MIYLVSHSLCDDGTASAWVGKKKFTNAEIFFTSHNWEWKTSLNLKQYDKVYFIDICPLPEDILDLIKKDVDFQVIDHHKTALDRINEAGIYELIKSKIVFDMNLCGTTLAWKTFFPNEKLPLLLKYIEIADLWHWDEEEDSKYVCEYIRYKLKANNIESFEKLMDEFNIDTAKKDGTILYKRLMRQVDRVCYNKSLLDFDGIKILAANDSVVVSEVGNELAQKSPSGLGMTYYFTPNSGQVKVSVRGKGAREFCEKFGGGGHDLASGFTIEIETFLKYLKTGKN